MNTKINGNRIVFGYTNCAAFNRKPEGDTRWYLTREERGAALSTKREKSTRQGLSESASISGIYPVKARLGSLDSDTREAIELGV